jgi:hypothetical protein
MQWGRRGRRATSTVALRGAVDFARRADNPTLLVRTLLNSAALSVGDDLPYALSAAAEAVELSPRASVEYRVFAYGNHLQALMLAGHWDELRERLTEADGDAFDLLGPLLSSLPLWLAEASGEAFDQEPVVLAVTDVTKRAWGWQQHLALARRSGDRDAVAEIARHASATAREVYPAFDDDFAHLWPRAVEALIATGRLDEAAAEIDEVTNSANQPPALLRAHLLRLRGLLALARDEDGEVLLREAIDAFDLFGAVPDAARARHALGDWLVAQGRGDEAQPLLAEARATYEELGADAWLARLEEPAVPR